MAKKNSTSTAVEAGNEKNPSTSTAAVKKKKKKKKMVTKCKICLHLFKASHLDKHMHSRLHHEAIQRLKGGEQVHRCWACGVSVSGLEQFSKHIESQEHISKMFLLQQRRQSGFPVDYNDEELNDLCAQRDQNRLLLKKQRNQEKLNKMKERRLQMKGFYPVGSHAAKWTWNVNNRVTCPSNNENQQGTMMGVVPGSTIKEGTWNKARYWQTSFTQPTMKDTLAQSKVIFSREEDKSQQSTQQDEVMQGQKRWLNVNTSEKQCLGMETSKDPRLFPSDSGQDYISRILTDVHTSLDGDCRNICSSQAPDPEKMLCNTLPFSSEPPQMSKEGQECKIQTCETKRTSSAYNHEDNLPTFTETDPQEKLGLTQEPVIRQVLPTLLSRSVSKTEASKPNLRTARGIRTSQKPSQDTKTRVLKPALQKLISSKNSQWRVNWKEIYREATHRKLQKEKGMPRFGIELVTPLPPDPPEDVLKHLQLDEGFQWASIECDPVTLPGFSADAEGQNHTRSSTDRTSWPAEEKKTENPVASGTSRSSELVTDRLENGDKDTSETDRNATPLENTVCVKMEKSDDYHLQQTLQESDGDGFQSVPETQIKQENQDSSHTDTLNNRLPKSQVNELLSMSLREVKLCSSLEDVDNQLLRAQATLQTAFLEVQRLQMIKQQVTAEMSSLRNKRLDILRRIKNSSLDQTPDADSPGPTSSEPST